MTAGQLDHIFPYFCFLYGVLMTVALNLAPVVRLAEERLPVALAAQWKAHRGLALICLTVGAAWILQDLWLA